MKVSFILPVYKVERYLDECVESIVAQTYRDIEVILVDDGSPDNCPSLCEQWANKDQRVKVIHKVNGGLSDARNVGLDNATGDYIIFVDSDDFWVSSSALQELMDTVQSYPECDFVGFNCSYFFNDTHTYKPWVKYDNSLGKPVDKNTAMRLLVASGTMPMSACLKVISRKSLSDIGLRFIKGTISEDIPWFIDLLDGSKECIFVNQYVYAYRQNRAGSITASGGEKSFNDVLNIIKSELDKIENRSFSQEAKNALYSFLAYEFCILLSLASKMPKEKRQDLLEYKWLLDYTNNPKVRKAAFVNKLFGIKATEWVLRYYNDKVRK